MADQVDKTYTESQLQALVADGVSRETAALAGANEELTGQLETANAKVAEHEATIAGLEAEKAAAEAAKDAVEAEFNSFKEQLEQAAEQARISAERLDQVKAAANGLFDDEYYTEDRVAQWAAMDEAVFAGVVETIEMSASKVKSTSGEKDELDNKKTEMAAKEAKEGKEGERETAAFREGVEPTSQATGGDSLLSRFLNAGRPTATVGN